MFKDDLKTELNKLTADEALLNQTRRRILDAQNVSSYSSVANQYVVNRRKISTTFKRHSVLIAALLMGIVGLSVFISILSSGVFEKSASPQAKIADQDVYSANILSTTGTGEAETSLFNYQEDEAKENSNTQNAFSCSSEEPASEIQIDAGTPIQPSLRNSINIANAEQTVVYTTNLPESSINLTICEYIDSDLDSGTDAVESEPELPIIEIVLSDVANLNEPVLLTSYWIPGQYDSAVIVDDYLYIATLSSIPSSKSSDEMVFRYAIDGLPWQIIEEVISLSDSVQSSVIVSAIHLHDERISSTETNPPCFVAVTGGILDISVDHSEIVVRDISGFGDEDKSAKNVRFRTLPNLERNSP